MKLKRLLKIAVVAFAVIMTAIIACSCMAKGGYMNGGYINGDMAGVQLGAGESYTEIVENEFVLTEETPTGYFSIDANTASYPNLRSLITNGYNIDKDAVRVEEMLNYFDYDYEAPTDGSVFKMTSSVFDTPYRGTKLMTIGLAAKEIEFSQTQNNLVFLIDVSGSMASADKLPLVQSAFKVLAENLNPSDRVSIVTYAGAESVALSGAYGREKTKIIAVIEGLFAGGSTAGSAGITTAYELAGQYFIPNGNNRVVLMTDGDFNVGVTSNRELERLISQKKESGIYFSVFGVGRGNLQSDKMETLALKGNGTYSYIDSVKEARRALAEQIGGSMITVAKDVKASVTFNAEYVASYRLIGYENKLLTQEEFEDENTDAGEVGSGHTITVAYEIKLTQKAFEQDDDLAQVKIRYKPASGEGQGQELCLDIKTGAYHSLMTASDAFVSSVIEFALILRDSKHKGNADINAVVNRLSSLDLQDELKAEFLSVVERYRDMYTDNKTA